MFLEVSEEGAHTPACKFGNPYQCHSYQRALPLITYELQVGVWVVRSETVASRDAGSELTGMYLQRVSEGTACTPTISEKNHPSPIKRSAQALAETFSNEHQPDR